MLTILKSFLLSGLDGRKAIPRIAQPQPEGLRSSGLGAAPQQAEKPFVLWKRNERFFAFAYADEADLLNVALFGCTAKAWREANPELAKKSNIRDYASISELTVLSNLETHNAELIRMGTCTSSVFWT